MKRTGIEIEMMGVSGGSGEDKAALMLAGKDYPDMVLLPIDGQLGDKYIESGAFINLTEHMDKMPNVVEMYGDNLNKTKYKDGNNYWLASYYGISPTDVVYAVNLRYDWMCELVGKERADSDEPFSTTELIDLLKKFKEKYPEVDGKETIPLTVWADFYIRGVLGMYGVKVCYVDEAGDVHYEFKDPKFLEAMHFYNQLYREGLLDPEWLSNNQELFKQKTNVGNVFGTIGAWYDANCDDLKKREGEDAEYRAYKVYAEGVDPNALTLSGRSSRGADIMGVTDNCKNVDAACKLLDFLASPEGQDLMLWGVEGETYTKEGDKYIPNEEYMEKLTTMDREQLAEETGVGRWPYCVKKETFHTDGSTGRIEEMLLDAKTAQARRNLAGTQYDKSEFDNLTPAGNTPAGLKAQKIADIQNEMYAKMVNASSEAEVDELYDTMIQRMTDAGLEEVEEAMNETYQNRLVEWGMK